MSTLPFAADSPSVSKLPVHAQVRHYYGTHTYNRLDNPADHPTQLSKDLNNCLRCIYYNDTSVPNTLTVIPLVHLPIPATSILGAATADNAANPVGVPIEPATLVSPPATTVTMPSNPDHGTIAAWLVTTRVPSSNTHYLTVLPSPISLDEHHPGNAKWGNRYVSGLLPGTFTRFHPLVSPKYWYERIQVMTVHFPFSPYRLHLGDTVLNPAEEEFNKDDRVSSLTPIREYFDANSWLDFVLPNPSVHNVVEMYGDNQPFISSSSRIDTREIILPVFFPIPLGYEIVPFTIECPKNIPALKAFYTKKGSTTAATWLCDNPLFVAWFDWAAVSPKATMDYTIIRPLRVITSPDAKRVTLIIQRIALDSFIAVRPSKDVINLYRTLKNLR